VGVVAFGMGREYYLDLFVASLGPSTVLRWLMDARRRTLYHGRRVKGLPIRTILRGKTVMENGKIIGKPGDGEHVKPLR